MAELSATRDDLVPAGLVDLAVGLTQARIEDAVRRLDGLVTPLAFLAGVPVVDTALPEEWVVRRTMPLLDSMLIVQPLSQNPQIVSVVSSSHG